MFKFNLVFNGWNVEGGVKNVIKNVVLFWKLVKVIIVCIDGGYGLLRVKCVIICFFII